MRVITESDELAGDEDQPYPQDHSSESRESEADDGQVEPETDGVADDHEPPDGAAEGTAAQDDRSDDDAGELRQDVVDVERGSFEPGEQTFAGTQQRDTLGLAGRVRVSIAKRQHLD